MGPVCFENFDLLVKVNAFSLSLFSFLFFFFWQAVRTGSDFQVGPGQTGSAKKTGQPASG